jgi:hypothetical protein
MGDFEECLEVNVIEEWGSFKGQHCLVETNVHLFGNRAEVRQFPVAAVALTVKQSLGLQFTHISSLSKFKLKE